MKIPEINYNDAIKSVAFSIVYNFDEYEFDEDMVESILLEHMENLYAAIEEKIQEFIDENTKELLECRAATEQFFANRKEVEHL